MSLFEDGHYRWRETYFVLFDVAKRPTTGQLRRMIDALPGRYEAINAQKDEQGLVESLTILSPDDFAALDVSYVSGEEVVEQTVSLLSELKPADEADKAKLKKLAGAGARLDVMHFEQLSDVAADSDEPDDMFDPSALLVVLDHLIELTDGVAVDPQAGALL